MATVKRPAHFEYRPSVAAFGTWQLVLIDARGREVDPLHKQYKSRAAARRAARRLATVAAQAIEAEP